MASPVVESIALELLDRLESLDGYIVVRPDREGSNITPSDKVIVVVQQPSVPNTTMSCHGNPPAMAFNVTFLCVCSVRNVYGNEPAYDSACNRAGADLIYAISHPADNSPGWWNFDGYALNANFGAIRPYNSSQGERAGVVVPVNVIYRVSENDHTEVRP